MKPLFHYLLPLLFIMAAAGYSYAGPINLYDEFFCPDELISGSEPVTDVLTEVIADSGAADEVVIIESSDEDPLFGRPFLLHDETATEKVNVDIAEVNLSLVPVCFYCVSTEPKLFDDALTGGRR